MASVCAEAVVNLSLLSLKKGLWINIYSGKILYFLRKQEKKNCAQFPSKLLLGQEAKERKGKGKRKVKGKKESTIFPSIYIKNSSPNEPLWYSSWGDPHSISHR